MYLPWPTKCPHWLTRHAPAAELAARPVYERVRGGENAQVAYSLVPAFRCTFQNQIARAAHAPKREGTWEGPGAFSRCAVAPSLRSVAHACVMALSYFRWPLLHAPSPKGPLVQVPGAWASVPSNTALAWAMGMGHGPAWAIAQLPPLLSGLVLHPPLVVRAPPPLSASQQHKAVWGSYTHTPPHQRWRRGLLLFNIVRREGGKVAPRWSNIALPHTQVFKYCKMNLIKQRSNVKKSPPREWYW